MGGKWHGCKEQWEGSTGADERAGEGEGVKCQRGHGAWQRRHHGEGQVSGGVGW